MARVLTIGLDGASFDLIRPWVSQGELPSFARILAGGASGELATTVPPMTFPAWTSFMTGVNPGKHGIFDFTERDPRGYGVRFVNANWRRARTLWQILSDAGKRVAVVSVPVTYPPEPVNGLMISGFDAPGMAGGQADQRSMFPPSLHQELIDKLGGYVISSNAVALTGKPDLALQAILATLDQKITCAKYLYQKQPWDFFMVLLGETDLVSHHFWKYHDTTSPLHVTPPSRDCAEAILAVYRKADAFIGDMLAMADPSTTVIVLSDHGMGGCGDTAVHLNLWLAQEGFLSFRQAMRTGSRAAARLSPERLVGTTLGTLKRVGLRMLPPNLKRWLLRTRPSLVNRVESYLRFGAIDWSRTTAFAEENPYYPPVWINLRGRDPQGTVAPEDYEATRSLLIERLTAWRCPSTGARLVKHVHRREDVYRGPWVHKAPDLLIEWHLEGRHSYVPRLSKPHESPAPVRKLTRAEWDSVKSGSHREAGVLMLHGRGIRRAHAVTGADILDVAPTILYLLGLPLPADLEGTVLEAALEEGLLRSQPRTHAASDAGSTDSPEADYSEDDAEVIEERLRGLGYLE